MKAKTILDAEKKDAIDIATELCYSEEVKRKIAQAKSVYEIGRILKQARLDQGFTLTRGVTCLFCGLDYPCPHMPGLEEQVAMAHKLRKEIEKNG